MPTDLQRWIGEKARANRSWGEERIASELLLKLGIRVSPRTIRRYMPAVESPRAVRRRSRGARSCHLSLGPGLADPPPDREAPLVKRHWIRNGHYVLSEPVVGGLHHEYRLVALAA